MIENEQSIARYTGNGTVKEFSIPFSFYKNADGAPETYQVAVYQRDVGAEEKKLDQETDYQVTWDEESRKGSITLTTPLPDQSILAIVREIPPTQEVEYEENAPFPYDGTNTALDKLTMLVQQQGEELSRKLGVSPTYDKTAEETMADVVDAKESAELAAERAKASATEANASAESALGSANLAKQYSDSASASADKAQEQAGDAALSKQGADEALAQLNNQVELAEQAAQEADAAKSAAQTSADSAKQSASSALDSSNTATEQAATATDAQKEATRASISCAVNEQRTLGYYNEVKRLAEVFNAEPATDTKFGFTRYATESEAEAGELNNVSSTPAQVKKAADKALTNSKSYTDTKSAESETYTDGQVLSAKQYADAVVSSHTGRTDNPHNVTKAQLGLTMVDNTSDIDKPVSSATQEALDKKADLVNGSIPVEQIPISFIIKDWRN